MHGLQIWVALPKELEQIDPEFFHVEQEQIPVAAPDILYEKQLTIKLGGETVIVNYIALSHSNNMSVITFPGYKAMQLTDIGQSNMMPYNDFLDFTMMAGWKHWIGF